MARPRRPLPPVQIRIQLFCAIGADAVAELRFRAVADIRLDLLPIAAVVADLLAAGADGNKAAEQLHLGKRLPQFLLQLFRLGDIPVAGAPADKPAVLIEDRLADMADEIGKPVNADIERETQFGEDGEKDRGGQNRDENRRIAGDGEGNAESGGGKSRCSGGRGSSRRP